MPCSPAEVPLYTEDVAVYIARVQGRLPGRNKGEGQARPWATSSCQLRDAKERMDDILVFRDLYL